MESISVIIPAYNEGARIVPTVRSIENHLRKSYAYEIILADDGSSDSTAEKAGKACRSKIKIVRNSVNSGKGSAVRKGLLAAKHPLVLFSDSDLSTPIEEVDSMIRCIRSGYDIVIASRNMKGSRVEVSQPFYRRFLGRTFPFLVNLVMLLPYYDTQCGFKLYRRDAARKIACLQLLDGWSFDVEQLFIAKKLGLKVKEVPVKWIDMKGSKVNPFKNMFTMAFDLIRIRYYQASGRYRI